MNATLHRLLVFLAILGLGIGAAIVLQEIGVSLWEARPAAAQGGEGQPPGQPTGDNSYCAICHSQPGRTMPLEDGSVLDLYVSPAMIADSAHGTNSPIGPLGCVDCHGADIFPHSGPSPENARAYRVETAALCSDCHNTLLADSAHLEAIAAGDLNAATCVDCHRAHDTPLTEDHPALVSAVCGDCHTDAYDQWRESPHASMQSLGCAVCHLPHGQQMRVRDINVLCESCHQAPSSVWVHDRHLESDYEVTCAICHMSYDPNLSLTATGNVPPTDHHMQVKPESCNQCHEELEQTGVWAELSSGDEQVRIERDALKQQVTQLESQISERNLSEESEINYIQLLQGLIAGLGIGTIAALILYPRLNRSAVNETGNGENGHDAE